MADQPATSGALRLLSALQLGDSFFPSGRYTLSHGLESFVELGLVSTSEELEALVADYVTEAVGRSDAVAVAAANRAAAGGDVDLIVEVDSLLWVMKLPAESSASSTRTGLTLLRAGGHLAPGGVVERYADEVREGRSPGNHATVFGTVAAACGLDAHEAVLVELHACATGLLGAALRTMRLDHVEAQGILRRLGPLMAATAENAVTTDFQDMSAFSPMIEIMQMTHERSHLRLFAS